jgi:mannose-1-phosphate guanylyltransferase/phosphomannomutase
VVDADAIRNTGFNIVVDYAFAATSQVLPDILQELGVNTIPLGARVDPNYISLQPETFVKELQQLAVIVNALSSDLGVRLDVGGEKIFLADDTGEVIPEAIVCAAMADLVLRDKKGRTVAVPVNLPSVFERIAKRHGGSILRTQVDLAPLMQAASGSGVVMAADGSGVFIFPDFLPVADGMMAVVRLLQFLARHNTRLSQVIAGLPPFHMASTTVECPWERKGSVMRQLHRKFDDMQTQVIDGVKAFLNETDWVLIRPDPDRPLFHVTVEAESAEQAQSLLDSHAELVDTLRSHASGERGVR